MAQKFEKNPSNQNQKPHFLQSRVRGFYLRDTTAKQQGAARPEQHYTLII